MIATLIGLILTVLIASKYWQHCPWSSKSISTSTSIPAISDIEKSLADHGYFEYDGDRHEMKQMGNKYENQYLLNATRIHNEIRKKLA